MRKLIESTFSRARTCKYVPELATGRVGIEQPTARAELEAGS
ncbi:hypothetical protein [Nonomuraea diastatica]|nr:hypothetical protein [Nonomuraea diastatica]